jgi:hypothetical protein
MSVKSPLTSALCPRGEGTGRSLATGTEDNSGVPSPLGEKDRMTGASA